MSSTNKTSNYNLSQFVGSDKPAWLADYNQDMSKIDAQMKLNADSATGADGKADANATNIGNLENLTTSTKTSLVSAINEVDGNTEVAQSTANTASDNASSALTKANQALGAVQNFNLTDISTVVASGANVVPTANTLTVAKNSDGSLCKIYGAIKTNYKGGSEATYTISDTGLRPSEAITVQGTLLRRLDYNDGTSKVFYQSFTLNTNGTITFANASVSNVDTITYMFMASLIFVKNFGDTPISE